MDLDTPMEEPKPEPEPEAKPEEDWGVFGTKKDRKKKKGGIEEIAEQVSCPARLGEDSRGIDINGSARGKGAR